MTGKLFVAIFAIFLVVRVSIAQDAPTDLSGKWTFEVTTQLGTGTPSIELKQQGDKLTGHYVGQLGEADLTGTVKGRTVTFSFSVNVQGMDLHVIYNGTIEGNAAMKGTVTFEGLGDGTFTAKKQ
jgi:hypothetical protein